jgi:hypothetical protein
MEIKNTLKTSEELLNEVLAKGLKFGLRGFQASASRALKDWVAEESLAVTPNVTDGARGPNHQFHTLLEEILVAGTKKDANGILVNLENFVEAIRSRKPAPIIQDDTAQAQAFAAVAKPSHKRRTGTGG